MKRIIGLTGGIGTGKTTVSRYITNNYNLPVLDADIYAREAVEPNSPILTKIWQRYGKKIILADGTLNRQGLGEIIFNDNQERIWLEEQIHPFVRQKFELQINQIPKDTLILAIPLLFEAKMTDLVTEIWLVSCSEKEQIRRLMERDSLSESQAIARIQSQLSMAIKLAKADIILDNSADLNFLFKQIDLALEKTKS